MLMITIIASFGMHIHNNGGAELNLMIKRVFQHVGFFMVAVMMRGVRLT